MSDKHSDSSSARWRLLAVQLGKWFGRVVQPRTPETWCNALASIIPLFVSPHLPERRLRSGPLLEAVLLRENLFRLEELLPNPSTAPAGMDIKSEKPESPDHFEDVETNISDQSEAPQYDAKETQRILRKVDFRLLPMLTLLYVLSFIDRSNSEVILSLEVRLVLTSLR